MIIFINMFFFFFFKLILFKYHKLKTQKILKEANYIIYK